MREEGGQDEADVAVSADDEDVLLLGGGGHGVGVDG